MRKKGKKTNKQRKRFVYIALMILVILVVLYRGYSKDAVKPVNINSNKYQSVEIPKGSSTGSIADILLKKKLIKSAFVFEMESRLNKYNGKYKAGDYLLSQNMTMYDIMEKLYKGDSDSNLIRFTIPEGYNLKQIADKLEKLGFINKEAFYHEIRSGNFKYKFLKGIPKGDNRLEGFLYPDTYEVYKNATEHEIIDKMLQRFDNLFTEAYYKRAKEMGLSVQQTITLASIIEREARAAQDRPVISSVFHNRLKINMPLQSCATVQYALGVVKPKLSVVDTQINSPYNTYKMKGLPPGPIASPRIESIQAALYPTNTNYIYFVAKGDGTHAFSSNYAQFLKDKAKYVQ